MLWNYYNAVKHTRLFQEGGSLFSACSSPLLLPGHSWYSKPPPQRPGQPREFVTNIKHWCRLCCVLRKVLFQQNNPNFELEGSALKWLHKSRGEQHLLVKKCSCCESKDSSKTKHNIINEASLEAIQCTSCDSLTLDQGNQIIES